METKNIGPIPIGDSLEKTVSNLVRRLSNDAKPFLVIVCSGKFVGISQARVNGLLVSFVSSGTEGLDEGEMLLSYTLSESNESYQFDPRDYEAFVRDMRRQ